MSRSPLSASGRPAAPSSTGSPSSSPLQASPVSELMLRFSCPGCQHRLLVSLRHLGLQSQCPHCGALVQAPPLTPQVVGYAALVQAERPALPRPSASLRVSSPPAASAPRGSYRLAKLLTRFFQFLGGLRLPRLSLPPLRRLGRFLTGLDIRSARWVTLGLYLLISVGLVVLSNAIMVGVFSLATVLWLLGGFFLLQAVVPSLLYPTYTCPGCHEVLESVGIWKCGCGYQDHRERHLLQFQCPLCQGRLGRTDCPRCGATILLR
jgi:predicted RNA-binding Zn-ribbon protein involved in translation (DUF1610 family)